MCSSDLFTQYALVKGDAANRELSADQVADALKDYDVIFIGEIHDHPGAHLAEMALFRALYARAPKLALSMEMFERDVQSAMDDYLAGKIGEEALRQKGRAWGNYAEAYRPLVEYAKDHGLAVIAAEVPTSVVRCVGIEGPGYLARMRAERRPWAAAELHLDPGPYRDKFMHFLATDGAHGQGDPTDASGQPTEATLKSFAAQVARDDTMAESISLHLQKNPGTKVLHVTGGFHVEGFLGTVERLKRRAPNLKVAVVMAAQVDDPKAPALSAEDAKGGNFAILLRAEPKPYATEAEEKAATEGIRGTIRAARNCEP